MGKVESSGVQALPEGPKEWSPRYGKRPGPKKGWGRWVDGWGRYDIRLHDQVIWLDRNQYHGRVDVQVWDRRFGKLHDRVGDVRLIGNFSPTWINFKGERTQIDQLLRKES